MIGAYAVKAPIPLKDGSVIPKGAAINVAWNAEYPAGSSEVTYEGRILRLRGQTIGRAIAGKVPTIRTLERWDSVGVCKTPTGATVEPDGIDARGCPSWLLLMGVI